MTNGLVTSDGTKVLTVEEYDTFIKSNALKWYEVKVS